MPRHFSDNILLNDDSMHDDASTTSLKINQQNEGRYRFISWQAPPSSSSSLENEHNSTKKTSTRTSLSTFLLQDKDKSETEELPEEASSWSAGKKENFLYANDFVEQWEQTIQQFHQRQDHMKSLLGGNEEQQQESETTPIPQFHGDEVVWGASRPIRTIASTCFNSESSRIKDPREQIGVARTNSDRLIMTETTVSEADKTTASNTDETVPVITSTTKNTTPPGTTAVVQEYPLKTIRLVVDLEAVGTFATCRKFKAESIATSTVTTTEVSLTSQEKIRQRFAQRCNQQLAAGNEGQNNFLFSLRYIDPACLEASAQQPENSKTIDNYSVGREAMERALTEVMVLRQLTFKSKYKNPGVIQLHGIHSDGWVSSYTVTGRKAFYWIVDRIDRTLDMCILLWKSQKMKQRPKPAPSSMLRKSSNTLDKSKLGLTTWNGRNNANPMMNPQGDDDTDDEKCTGTAEERIQKQKTSSNQVGQASEDPNTKEQDEPPELTSTTKKSDDPKIPPGGFAERLEMAMNLASALIFLHARNWVIHLRPSKIGFDARNGRLKICDLSEARPFVDNTDDDDDDDDSNDEFAGDQEIREDDKGYALSNPPSLFHANDAYVLPYVAPEVLCENNRATGAADVYAFTMILWELLTLQTPFGQLYKKVDPQQEDPTYHSIRSVHMEFAVRRHERPIMDGAKKKKNGLGLNWSKHPQLYQLVQQGWDPHVRPTMKTMREKLDEITMYEAEDDNDTAVDADDGAQPSYVVRQKRSTMDTGSYHKNSFKSQAHSKQVSSSGTERRSSSVSPQRLGKDDAEKLVFTNQEAQDVSTRHVSSLPIAAPPLFSKDDNAAAPDEDADKSKLMISHVNYASQYFLDNKHKSASDLSAAIMEADLDTPEPEVNPLTHSPPRHKVYEKRRSFPPPASSLLSTSIPTIQPEKAEVEPEQEPDILASIGDVPAPPPEHIQRRRHSTNGGSLDMTLTPSSQAEYKKLMASNSTYLAKRPPKSPEQTIKPLKKLPNIPSPSSVAASGCNEVNDVAAPNGSERDRPKTVKKIKKVKKVMRKVEGTIDADGNIVLDPQAAAELKKLEAQKQARRARSVTRKVENKRAPSKTRKLPSTDTAPVLARKGSSSRRQSMGPTTVAAASDELETSTVTTKKSRRHSVNTMSSKDALSAPRLKATAKTEEKSEGSVRRGRSMGPANRSNPDQETEPKRVRGASKGGSPTSTPTGRRGRSPFLRNLMSSSKEQAPETPRRRKLFANPLAAPNTPNTTATSSMASSSSTSNNSKYLALDGPDGSEVLKTPKKNSKVKTGSKTPLRQSYPTKLSNLSDMFGKGSKQSKNSSDEDFSVKDSNGGSEEVDDTTTNKDSTQRENNATNGTPTEHRKKAPLTLPFGRTSIW